jgi:probable biosynthetic protein (TIGR04098 family)
MRTSFSLELGMPHLGRNNLSESALFKAIGNDRWKQIEERGGVPTSLIRDDAGSRLYATFFFLEINYAPDHPIAAHGENDVVEYLTDLTHYGKVYLDGKYRLGSNPELWIRASNVFIYQERGPSKLSMSVPDNMSFEHIPELEAQPDSLMHCRRARPTGSFLDREADDVDLYEGEREYVYQLDEDRDMNGAGLVYFANFVTFLERAERGVLAELRHRIPAEALDARSTYRRRIGYYGNAQATDRLHVFVKSRARAVQGASGQQLLDLGFDYRIRRESDDKEVLISSSRKVSPMESRSDTERWFQAMTR